MNNKIGFKTEAYKTENYLPVVQEEKNETATQDLEEQLRQIGWIKAHKVVLQYLEGSIYVGVLIEELNIIKRHFINL